MNNAGKHGCISASKVDNNFNMISSSLYDRRISQVRRIKNVMNYLNDFSCMSGSIRNTIRTDLYNCLINDKNYIIWAE